MFEVKNTDNGFTVSGDPAAKVYSEESKAKRRSRDLTKASNVVSFPDLVRLADIIETALGVPLTTQSRIRGVYPAISKHRTQRRAYA